MYCYIRYATQDLNESDHEKMLFSLTLYFSVAFKIFLFSMDTRTSKRVAIKSMPHLVHTCCSNYSKIFITALEMECIYQLQKCNPILN